MIKSNFVNIIILWLASFGLLHSQTNANDTTSTILLQNQGEQNAREIITGKTDRLPSGTEEFLPEQDSVFQAAMETRIPFLTRARSDIMYSERAWIFTKELFKGTPWQMAIADIQRLNPDLFKPLDVDVATHEYHLRQSLHVPFVNTIPVGGLKMDLDDISVFFGIKEDVSPVIKYSIDYTTEVEVVIYSIRASVIATLYSGVQKPGNYRFTWNLRDDYGKPMPPGDYIAEVRIGKERYLRKLIEIP